MNPDRKQVELDGRKRLSLKRLVGSPAKRYLVTKHDDGSLLLTPLVATVERSQRWVTSQPNVERTQSHYCKPPDSTEWPAGEYKISDRYANDWHQGDVWWCGCDKAWMVINFVWKTWERAPDRDRKPI